MHTLSVKNMGFGEKIGLGIDLPLTGLIDSAMVCESLPKRSALYSQLKIEGLLSESALEDVDIWLHRVFEILGHVYAIKIYRISELLAETIESVIWSSVRELVAYLEEVIRATLNRLPIHWPVRFPCNQVLIEFDYLA